MGAIGDPTSRMVMVVRLSIMRVSSSTPTVGLVLKLTAVEASVLFGLCLRFFLVVF